MSALDPNRPSQPSQSDTYQVSENPASKQPTEASVSGVNKDASTIESRTAQQQSSINEATSSALGRGIEGAPPGEESKGQSHEDIGRHNELDAEQMAAPGEGKVWSTVEGNSSKPGSGGEQPDFMSDLDRKKKEQAPMRSAIDEQKEKTIDVAGILGQRGGPSNPIDKNNYPNTSG